MYGCLHRRFRTAISAGPGWGSSLEQGDRRELMHQVDREPLAGISVGAHLLEISLWWPTVFELLISIHDRTHRSCRPPDGYRPRRKRTTDSASRRLEVGRRDRGTGTSAMGAVVGSVELPGSVKRGGHRCTAGTWVSRPCREGEPWCSVVVADRHSHGEASNRPGSATGSPLVGTRAKAQGSTRITGDERRHSDTAGELHAVQRPGDPQGGVWAPG